MFLMGNFATAGHAQAVVQQVPGHASFTPLEEWKKAVIAGDKAALARLYSVDPPTTAQVGQTKVDKLDEELRFWAGLKASGVTEFHPKPLDIGAIRGMTRVILRVDAKKGGDEASVLWMTQYWVQQAEGWRILATYRGEFFHDTGRRLPEPATPNPNL
ncbi:MAG: nuclear transport factor 2 family protein, partial [Bryobacteraceae bacterium]